jgi:hypothetical protein
MFSRASRSRDLESVPSEQQKSDAALHDDVVAITQLVARERESRDLCLWNRMRACYHADAEIDISWFRGTGHAFVAASQDMVARGMRATHRLGPVLVTLNGDRALATAGAIIDIPTGIDGRDFVLSAHCVLVYRVLRRDDVWRLASFEAFYRRDELAPAVLGDTVELPRELLFGFRPSYRNLCYSLHLVGYQPRQDLPGEDRPESVRALLSNVYAWLGLPLPD